MNRTQINYRQEAKVREKFSERMAWGLAAFVALQRHAVTDEQWTAWVLSPDGSDEFDQAVARYAPRVGVA